MRSIIVGTDFSKGSLVALEIATEIANVLKTDICLMWVQQPSGLLGLNYDKQTETLAKQRLDEIAQEYGKRLKENKIVWEIQRGKVAPIISAKASELNAPIIVIGTNGASGYEKYVVGSTATRIVQESPCPTLTVREGYSFANGIRRIVLPLRPNSDNTRQKVPPTAEIARIFKAEVALLGLYNYPEEISELRVYMDQASQYLFKEGVQHTASIQQCTNYCDAVIQYAESINADIMVINTEQDKVLQKIFLGTNAQQIVHKSQIPVLCVHPNDIFNVAR
ncbi:MAG: universal stress protein [Bacteroidales bacterium]|nr:universal stress protein [Bacteroidales bacterium]